jgi:hypothetical protein
MGHIPPCAEMEKLRPKVAGSGTGKSRWGSKLVLVVPPTITPPSACWGQSHMWVYGNKEQVSSCPHFAQRLTETGDNRE